MPHKCLDCNNVIESGTIDLQKGCPVCGGKKFQYIRPPKQEQGSRPGPTVSEYVAAAALREPQEEAKASPVSRFPEKQPKQAMPRPSYEMPAPKAPVKKAARKRAPEQDADRIESIRIVDDGTYDINLPLLLSRKELVMSREEGNYVLDLNSALKPEKKKKRKKQA